MARKRKEKTINVVVSNDNVPPLIEFMNILFENAHLDVCEIIEKIAPQHASHRYLCFQFDSQICVYWTPLYIIK